MKVDIVSSLEHPEYTGANRCGPCTVLNLILAVLLSSLLARKSKIGGLIAVLVSVGVIYLRGYLLPGTPTLTKHYLPPVVLRWFGKNPEPELATGLGSNGATEKSEPPTSEEESIAPTHSVGDEPTSDDANATNDENSAVLDSLETLFVQQEILEPCAVADDLCLTESFETAWFEETKPFADVEIPTSEVLNAFGIEDNEHEFNLVTQNEAYFLESDLGLIGQWPSRAALIADIAASRVLRSWIPNWESYHPQEKGQLLNGLRMFLETCPTTGEEVRIGEEAVESCCSSHKVITVTCEETGQRLFEHRLVETESEFRF